MDLTHRAETAFITGAVAALGAVAFVVKVIEHVSDWVEYQTK